MGIESLSNRPLQGGSCVPRNGERMNLLELAACVLGLVGVFLMAREVRAGFLIAMGASLLSVELYREEALYSQMLLNLGYFGLQVYGWACWGADAEHRPVTRLDKRAWLWLALAIIPTALLTKAMASAGAQLPAPDAAVTVYSLLAQYWMARKKRECWLLFIVADLGAAAIAWTTGLKLVAGLFIIYMAIGAMGYATWRAE